MLVEVSGDGRGGVPHLFGDDLDVDACLQAEAAVVSALVLFDDKESGLGGTFAEAAGD